MKKRFLCLALCLLMVLPMVFSSCASTSDAETTDTSDSTSSTTSTKAMTITLYSITGDSTTEDDIARVQAALNQITEAEFNTHILLKLYKESEYDAALDGKLQDVKDQIAAEEAAAESQKAAEKAAKEAAAAKGETVAKTTEAESDTTETDETIINSYGLEETVYPPEDGTQVDIFLIRGLSNLNKYAGQEILTSLDEQLSIGSKILKQYIYPTFLTAAKVNSSTVAIPNNHLVGDYQYLLVDKALFDKYSYDPDSVNSISDLSDFFADVIKNDPDYTALMNQPDPEVTYFTPEASLIGASVSKKAAAGAAAAPKDLLSVSGFTNYYKLMLTLKQANAIGGDGASLDDGKKYAAAIITGDPTTPDEYKDNYYVYTYKYPTATNDNVYNGMYAISTYAADVDRCMEIVDLLTTDSDFINTFQYGVEGTDYTIDEATGYVKSKSTYSMNRNYTGNEFLMKQSTDMSDLLLKLSADNWALAKKQNLDMVYNPYLGFQLSYKDKDGNDLKSGDLTVQQIMDGIVADSKDYLSQIDAFVPYDEDSEESYLVKTAAGDIETRTRTVTKTVTVDDFISDLSAQVDADIYIAACLNKDDENSPLSQYNTWYAAAYPSAS